MKRRSDWEARLVAYLAAAEGKAHAYGRHDCLLFVAGAVKAQTGRDPARGHRGKYRTVAGAARYLKHLGFASPAAMIAAHLEEKGIGFARRGDIVVDGEGIPGVVIGGEALFVGEAGMVRQRRSAWRQAWGV